MFKYYLSVLLVTLIALQSMTASADFHSSHNDEKKHEQSDHAHQDSNSIVIEEENKLAESTTADCQHCCQCHGSSHGFINTSSSKLYDSSKSRYLSGIRLGYQAPNIGPDLPPPIA